MKTVLKLPLRLSLTLTRGRLTSKMVRDDMLS
jgi:hypothetical protein